MGHRRPHRLALGLSVLSAALGTGIVLAGPGESQTGSSDVMRGRIDATGTAQSSGDWSVRRSVRGEYRIEFAGDQVQLEIDRWDAVADATVIPIGDGADIVRFTNDTGPVDTSFTFTAIVGR